MNCTRNPRISSSWFEGGEMLSLRFQVGSHCPGALDRTNCQEAHSGGGCRKAAEVPSGRPPWRTALSGLPGRVRAGRSREEDWATKRRWKRCVQPAQQELLEVESNKAYGDMVSCSFWRYFFAHEKFISTRSDSNISQTRCLQMLIPSNTQSIVSVLSSSRCIQSF